MGQTAPGGVAVELIIHDAGVTAAVTGDLDLNTSPVLLDQVGGVFEGEPSELTMDLTGVAFCDSAGISALIGLRQRGAERGWVLRVVNPQPAVRRMLVDFTGLGDYLNVT